MQQCRVSPATLTACGRDPPWAFSAVPFDLFLHRRRHNARRSRPGLGVRFISNEPLPGCVAPTLKRISNRAITDASRCSRSTGRCQSDCLCHDLLYPFSGETYKLRATANGIHSPISTFCRFCQHGRRSRATVLRSIAGPRAHGFTAWPRSQLLALGMASVSEASLRALPSWMATGQHLGPFGRGL